MIRARQSSNPISLNSDHDQANTDSDVIAPDAEMRPAIRSAQEISRRVRRAIHDALDHLSRSSATNSRHGFIARLTSRSQEREAVAKQPDRSLATFGIWIYGAGDYRRGGFLQQTIGMPRDELEVLAERLGTDAFGLRCGVRECKY